MKVLIGDFDSHMSFLVAHGFVTEEELETNRKFLQERRDHPERFETLTLDQMLEREGITVASKEREINEQ